MKHSKVAIAVSLVSALIVSGCANIGKQAPLAEAVNAQSLNLPNYKAAAPISPVWWTQLNDAKLNNLIDNALSQSPDLASVIARLQQARAGSSLAESQLGPQVQLTAKGASFYHKLLSDERSISSDVFGNGIDSNLLGVVSKTADTVENKANDLVGHDVWYGTTQLQGKWTWDLWGEHKNEIAAALGKEQALAYELSQTKLLLAQGITAQYMKLQMLMAQKGVLNDRLKIKHEQVALATDRIRAGVLPASQLYPLQMAIQQLQTAIKDLDDKADQTRHVLAALSAQSPTALEGFQPEPIRALPEPPARGITADLLGKRADIAAQREAIYSRKHLISAAEAKFYPNIEISALAGFSVLKIGELPNAHSFIAGLLPTITLPIFTSGALTANLKQKRAEYDEQIARYNKSVYTALKEAADALSAYRTAADSEVL